MLTYSKTSVKLLKTILFLCLFAAVDFYFVTKSSEQNSVFTVVLF